MKKETKRKLGYGALGFLTGAFTRIPHHEAGHTLVAKLVGATPKHNQLIEFHDYGLTGGRVNYINTGDNLLDSMIAFGGPAANYLVGLGTAFAASKLDKHTNPKSKAFLTGFSILNSIHPAGYCIMDKFNLRGNYLNDFDALNANGIPYEITIPLTAGISAALIYYNLRGWKDTVEKNTKRVHYYGMRWKDKRREWKERKNYVIGEFEEYFDGLDYKPSFKERAKAKILRRDVPEIKAKKAWKKLNKIEVVGDGYKEKDLRKFSEYLGLDMDKTKKLVEDYVWSENIKDMIKL